MTVDTPQVKPLPYRRRQYLFFVLLVLFIISLPFLYLYAVGYRFEFGEQNFISTGGIYVAAERTGAEIYIDDELVRETRVFRRAFYAQSLETGTHRVHVQKEGNHTWVKELPVYPHIVTEAQAFNLPLVPRARIIAPRVYSTVPVIMSTTSLQEMTPINEFLLASSSATSSYTRSEEYTNLIDLFVATSSTSTVLSTRDVVGGSFVLPSSEATTTTEDTSTTTKESGGVRLFERNGEVYAKWVGVREGMPYYYCSEPFSPYSTSTPLFKEQLERKVLFGNHNEANTAELLHPVQTVPDDADCDPEIQMDRREQSVSYFDFLPGSTDLVILGLEDGIYLSEIDDRAWQNIQPIMAGEGLSVRVENGSIYVYDGELIYEVITQ